MTLTTTTAATTTTRYFQKWPHIVIYCVAMDLSDKYALLQYVHAEGDACPVPRCLKICRKCSIFLKLTWFNWPRITPLMARHSASKFCKFSEKGDTKAISAGSCFGTERHGHTHVTSKGTTYSPSL